MSNGKGLYPKRFGQVILNNPEIAKFEVKTLDISPGHKVLEIGPGEGALTRHILEHDVELFCVESDNRFITSLRAVFGEEEKSGKLHLIKENFLNFPPDSYDRIIGNIPYHISSDVIFRLPLFDFELAVLMVQLDFAERMIAKPSQKGYSRLSVNTAFQFDTHIVRKVGRYNFRPVPKVDSAVITITKREERKDIDPKKLDDLLIKLFSSRRKKIGTVIKECPGELRNMRPEELTLEQFISVTNSWNPP